MHEFDGHRIKDWTLYVVRLDEAIPDVFPSADGTPVAGRNYKRYRTLDHHLGLHCIAPSS